ncbi:MAG: hypothetical protein GEU92_21440, partial [Alphaproteobacteria bacterium]|nr:hypothetical protein [Alphaproteobacteria bacterium]
MLLARRRSWTLGGGLPSPLDLGRSHVGQWLTFFPPLVFPPPLMQASALLGVELTVLLQLLGRRGRGSAELVSVLAQAVTHHRLTELQLPRLETLREASDRAGRNLLPRLVVMALALWHDFVRDLLW